MLPFDFINQKPDMKEEKNVVMQKVNEQKLENGIVSVRKLLHPALIPGCSCHF